MSSLIQSNKWLLVFLLVLSLSGCFVVWLATSGFGAGLSSDAIRNISAGQNFIEGKGLITSSGDPLVSWPPMYALLLGYVSRLFHSDVYIVGMYLNILVFGAIIFCSGLLFALVKPNNIIFTILGSLVVFSSPSLIRICANVAPDPLFILFVISFLIAASNYIHKPSTGSFSWMLIAALFGASQRYPGMALVFTGAILILHRQRAHPWHMARDVTLFSLISSAPTIVWIYFHNFLGYGTLIGSHFQSIPWKNMTIATQKFVHWFIPGVVTNLTDIWVWVAITYLILIISLVRGRKRLRSLFSSGTFLPACVFTIIYGLSLIFILSYKEHRPLLWDRVHIVLLVPLLVMLIGLFPMLIPKEYLSKWRYLIPALLIGFGLWLVYPLVSTGQYVIDSIQNGEASLYNIHNTKPIRESELAEYLKTFNPPKDSVLYSNYNETAWFLTRRQVYGVPTVDNEGDWPGISREMYLIWFDLPELRYMPKTMLILDEIRQKANLIPLYIGVDGSLYRIIPFPAK